MKTSVGVAVLILLCASALPAQMCEEEVAFYVGDGSIEVQHSQTSFNCCAWLGFEVYQEGSAIDIFEWEHLDPPGGCNCLCCFDVQVVIGGLEAGEYTVTVTKRYDGGAEEVLGPWTVTVTGSGEPVLLTSYLPCAAASVHEQAETSWGMIKSQYR